MRGFYLKSSLSQKKWGVSDDKLQRNDDVQIACMTAIERLLTVQ